MSYIENEGAYQAAIARKMRANSRKGVHAWLAADATRPALIEAIAKMAYKGGFAETLDKSFQEWGKLSPKQEDAARRLIAQAAERKAAFAQRDSGSVHIGSVGDKLTLTLTISTVVSFNGMYGQVFITIMKDSAGNVVVYKGSKELGEKGATVSIKATVKEHGVRDGVNQTILTRPKLV